MDLVLISQRVLSSWDERHRSFSYFLVLSRKQTEEPGEQMEGELTLDVAVVCVDKHRISR